MLREYLRQTLRRTSYRLQLTMACVAIPLAFAAVSSLVTALDAQRLLRSEAGVSTLVVDNLAVMAAFSAILLIVVRLLSSRLVRPLHTLRAMMDRVGAGEQGIRALPAGPRDAVALSCAFNHMVAAGEEREAQLKLSLDDALRIAMARTQFAATMGYEIRTGLNGIVGMLQILREAGLDGQQGECVDAAWKSSHTLIALLNDMLDLSKIQAGKLTLEEVEFDLRQLLDEIIELCMANAMGKTLRISRVLEPDVPDRIRGDPLRLRQILMNLVGNAVKFTEAGEVALRVQACVKSPSRQLENLDEPALTLRFEVEDTGIGIAQSALDDLFQPYTRVVGAAAEKFAGTGLGLAICKQLLELMGGEIGACSSPGTGSVFWFTLVCKTASATAPRALPAEAAHVAVEDDRTNRLTSQAHAESNPLVLVVDGDRSTRDSLRATLQCDGFRVEEAADGAEALQILKRVRPDAILMDATMPGMDGFTACVRVREMTDEKPIPVLMVTALEDNASIQRAFAVGASDVISKPIHFAVLSQRVQRIVEIHQAENRIRQLAYNDLLTGLPNRSMFFAQLGQRLELARLAEEPIAVLCLDLDRFKNVNDSLGHDIGDRLLIAVSQRLRQSVRNADSVARLGSDEFAVVLSDIGGPHTAAAAAQNLICALSAPFPLDGHDIFVAASVGISLYPNDGHDAGTLLKRANTARYCVKKNNGGFQFFEPSMEHARSESVRLENDLRRALARGELEVFYQPQARVDDGCLIGMEALVRWHHPAKGTILPGAFIPLAEETGIIHCIGEWVLRTACFQLKAWLESGMQPMWLAVNVSVRQLLQSDFFDVVEQVLSETGLAPQLLELEITETTLMESAHDTLQALHRLHALGVRLAIDDFGTGYSSLSYLKRFPVDIIKIDRSFVRDVNLDANDAAIVTGIIALAHSLDVQVVAEGVETSDQLRFLQERRCDVMQGYFLSKPVPADEFVRYVSARLQA